MANNIQIKKSDFKKAELVRDIIKADPSKHFTIPQLAKKGRINEYILKAAFKEIFGMGMYEYHKVIKMDIAMEMVKSSNKELKVIVKEAGFGTITGFITSFKKQFNITPGRLLRQRRHKEEAYEKKQFNILDINDLTELLIRFRKGDISIGKTVETIQEAI